MAHKKNRMNYSKIVQNDSCLRWFPILLIISGWSLGQVMCPVPSAGKKLTSHLEASTDQHPELRDCWQHHRQNRLVYWW
jgi:hypothetical protein